MSKYRENLDISSEGLEVSSDKEPLLETSTFSLYFSGSCILSIRSFRVFYYTKIRGETSVLRLVGGGSELVFPDQKGVAEVVPGGRTWQSLINISFPTIVGGGAW
jgi:hypothetical protein